MSTAEIGGMPAACNRDCGATCALLVQEPQPGIYRITGNPLNHPMKKPCPRGLRSIESRSAPDRLTVPLVRRGARGRGQYDEISWDDAIDMTADRLGEVIQSHGPEAILNTGGSGACKGALHNTSSLVTKFLNLLGPVTNMTGSYSFQAANTVLPYIYGIGAIGYDASTLMDTRFMILWGANIADTRFGNESEQVIRHIKSSGGEVIVIDPRRTRTAVELGTEWIAIRPGTDTAAMLSIARVLDTEGLLDQSFLDKYASGSDDLLRYVRGKLDGIEKSPEWAESICGISADILRRLAIRFGNAEPAALVPGFSIQRVLGGEDAYRMCAALQALTGNTGRPGGTPGTNMWFGLPGPKISRFAGPRSEGGSIPKAIWPLAVLGGTSAGYRADIKAAYVTGSNYINQGSDIRKNIEAFESLDLVVCHEMYMTPTARYADIILPATHFLEREDVIIPPDNYLYYSSKIFDPVGEARDDFDIFAAVSERLGFSDHYTGGLSKEQWINRIIDESDVTRKGRERFKAEGIYDGGEHKRYGLTPFIEDPMENPLDTPSGKIELSSEKYAETGFPAWPVYRPLPAEDDFPLMLVTPHSRFRINSTGSNIGWVDEREPVTLWINPEDAEVRGIFDGDTVRVKSRTGKLDVTVYVTKDVMPGVVSCIQGGWFGTDPSEVGGSVNWLTPLDPTLPSMGTRTHTVFVEVTGRK